ncbi:MAG: hypothetical protein H6825_10755 [Planctomycetes bacterium]|nr:hypothetical protein [Planctomycetota bacterium]
MTPARSSVVAVVVTALAALFAAPLVSDGVSSAVFEDISLASSTLTLTSTSSMTYGSGITPIGWEVTTGSTGVLLKIVPEEDTALKVGDSAGNGGVNIPDGVATDVVISYVPALEPDVPTQCIATFTIETAMGPETYTLDLGVRGEWDTTGEIGNPTIQDYGTVPGDPTRLRKRVWVEIFGLSACITLIDG